MVGEYPGRSGVGLLASFQRTLNALTVLVSIKVAQKNVERESLAETLRRSVEGLLVWSNPSFSDRPRDRCQL